MKIDPLSDRERRVVRTALRSLISSCGRGVEGPLAGALLMARIEEAARELSGELVRDARAQERLTWTEIGKAFGITMQSAQWRFGRRHRRSATRMRR